MQRARMKIIKKKLGFTQALTSFAAAEYALAASAAAAVAGRSLRSTCPSICNPHTRHPLPVSDPPNHRSKPNRTKPREIRGMAGGRASEEKKTEEVVGTHGAGSELPPRGAQHPPSWSRSAVVVGAARGPGFAAGFGGEARETGRRRRRRLANGRERGDRLVGGRGEGKRGYASVRDFYFPRSFAGKPPSLMRIYY